MRTLYLIISLMVSALFIAKGEGVPSPKTVERDWQVDTNGLSYEVLIYTNSSDVPDLLLLNHVKPKAPVCWIDGWGEFTNVGYKFYLWMPPTNLCRLELFDSKGQAVEKTTEGKMFGLPRTQEQIAAWDRAAQKKNGGAFSLWHLCFAPAPHAGDPIVPTAGPIVFSLQPLFQIKQPGEYTLHLSLRLIQTKEDSSGQVYFPMVWLPEVTAKVQIRPEDIPLLNLPPNGQTNSPTK